VRSADEPVVSEEKVAMEHRLAYPIVCTLLGAILGWAPVLVHGPIAERFDALFMKGWIAVWAFYASRLLIGFFVGVSRWPRPWYVRVPLCGFLLMLPPGLIALSAPGCGSRCMLVNELSAMAIGTAVAGLARAITGKDHL
jgi:hypothetical protein